MSQADFERWEARYAQPGPAQAVDPFLIDIDNDLPTRGRALDVAGGAGRHALFLAARGLDVTLVDISPTGLDLAVRRARDAGVALGTQALDLETETLPGGPFNAARRWNYRSSNTIYGEKLF